MHVWWGWQVAREASTRVLGLRPFDVQLMGGMILHEGQIAEMRTGEGKTLVAVLPAFLNALSGKGVHVVTVRPFAARKPPFLFAPRLADPTIAAPEVATTAATVPTSPAAAEDAPADAAPADGAPVVPAPAEAALGRHALAWDVSASLWEAERRTCCVQSGTVVGFARYAAGHCSRKPQSGVLRARRLGRRGCFGFR